MEYAIIYFSGGVLAVGVYLGRLLFIGRGKNKIDAEWDLYKQSNVSRAEWKKVKIK